MHDFLQRPDIIRIAGYRTCLDPGVSFPFSSLNDQILLDHIGAGYKRAGLSVGSQGHIDAESEAVFGNFRESLDEPFAQPGKKFLIGKRTLSRFSRFCFPVFGINEDEVDI